MLPSCSLMFFHCMSRISQFWMDVMNFENFMEHVTIFLSGNQYMVFSDLLIFVTMALSHTTDSIMWCIIVGLIEFCFVGVWKLKWLSDDLGVTTKVFEYLLNSWWIVSKWQNRSGWLPSLGDSSTTTDTTTTKVLITRTLS